MKKYTYCPHCSSKLALIRDIPHCSLCNITYYQNSRPTAGILPLKNGKVLLSRRAIEPHKGALDTIGGFLNYGEHPLDGAKREAKEETGLDIDNLEFFSIVMDQYGGNGLLLQNTFYTCTISEEKPTPMDDVASLEWIDIDKLPLDSSIKGITEVLEKLKFWYQNKRSTSKQL